MHTLDGSDESLKERVIGAAVLERSPDYNTADDPVVRIRAADVRKRLAMYYQDEDQGASIRITSPSGSYGAVFRASDDVDAALGNAKAAPVEHLPEEHSWPTTAEVPGLAPGLVPGHGHDERQPVPAGPPHVSYGIRPGSGRRVKPAIFSVLLVLLVAAASAWYVRHEAQKEFNAFWAPIFEPARPPIIYVGSNAVYRLSSSFLQRYQAAHPSFSGLESLASIDPCTDLRRPGRRPLR